MSSRAEREQERHERRVQRALYFDRWDELVRAVTQDRRELQRADNPDPATLKRFLYNVRVLQDALEVAGARNWLMGELPPKPTPERAEGGRFQKGPLQGQVHSGLRNYVSQALRR
jgi:hypothetical protein